MVKITNKNKNMKKQLKKTINYSKDAYYKFKDFMYPDYRSREIVWALCIILFGMLVMNFGLWTEFIDDILKPAKAQTLTVREEAIRVVKVNLETTLTANPKEQIIRLIRQKAKQYNINEELAIKIAKAENTILDPSLKNPLPSSTATGIYQITKATWLDGCKRRNINWTLEDRKDAEKNIDMAMWFIGEKKELWRWNESKHNWNK